MHRNKIGEKKRIALPKKFRDELGDSIILTRGYEGALIIVNKKMWENIAKDVIHGSFINKDIRDTSRFLVGGASEIKLDSQGRFVIPEALFDYANLKTDIVFLGLVNWIEIWDKNKWEDRLKYLQSHGEEIAQEINKLSQSQN